MSTTVHLPHHLLSTVDHRAQELGMSRNRYIIRALEQAIDHETRWSSRFVEKLEEARADEEGRRTIEEMIDVIAMNRSSKMPPEF